MNQKVYLCFDIGATTTKVGYIDPLSRKIIHRTSFKTRENDGSFNVVNLIKNLETEVDNCLKKFDVLYVGISTAGVVNMKTGTITYTNDTMRGYVGTNWKQRIKTKFDLNCMVLNDVKAAGIAELGQRPLKSGVMVTLGTGFGAAIFIDGKLYTGTDYCAGEIGQIVWPFDQSLTVDSACSAVLTSEKIKALIHDETFKLTESAKIRHNTQALQVREQWMKNIAYILQMLNCFYNPELFVIGGGVSCNHNLIEQIIKFLPGNFKPVEVAKYTNDAAFFGLIEAIKSESLLVSTLNSP